MTTTQNEDHEFEIGQAVEVTTYVQGGVDQWERATVYEIRRDNLSDRFVEVKYANGMVGAVLKSRVRPAP